MVRTAVAHPPFDHVIVGSFKGCSAHHCESDMYVCSLCNQSFSTQGSLKRHRESVGFSRRVCRQRFYRKDVRRRHLKTHQPAVLLGDSAAGATVDLPPPPPPPPPPSPPLKKQKETPVCEICAKRFLSQNALKRHRQTVHRQSGGFLCRVCDRRFYRKDHLKRYHNRKHGHKEYEAPASYPCPLCQKSFHYRGHLREHLKTHHPTITSSSPPTAPARLLNISFLQKSAGRTPQISFLRTYQCFRGSSDGLVTLERLVEI